MQRKAPVMETAQGKSGENFSKSKYAQTPRREEFKDGAMIPILKERGNKQECSNYRGISLRSTAGKLLGRLIQKRLQTILDAVLPESQCGFHNSRSTTDTVFIQRQLQQKGFEQNMYFVFIDFIKAFDSLNRECLWILVCRYGCPESIVSLISQLQTGFMAQVSLNGTLSEQVLVNQGVKIDCARELPFADDSAMASRSESELQGMLDALAQSLGPIINTTKILKLCSSLHETLSMPSILTKTSQGL
ncbi:uncharacterized protein LOC125025302 [Penaeus chinensis]|uniref:uncharacterized protein LOC125025302 n=1 Tax=Penaeus chinensis TaxID=139456 RepID=UPI001FB71875|nr:uncharacterized protein LOC125025302 [Penaeus chinensis]